MGRLLVMGRALFESMRGVNHRENQNCAAGGKRLLFFRPRRVRLRSGVDAISPRCRRKGAAAGEADVGGVSFANVLSDWRSILR